ncbi:MAG: hypothetical protein AAFU85_06205 [Planctomycetota bacterium]
MPKPLVFQMGDRDIAFNMSKVDRSKLYGYKEVKALNDDDSECDLATLAGDGCTVIGKGGTGLGWMDADGNWSDKSLLTPVDSNGEEIEPVASSFAAPIKLFDTATPEDYLEHNVRLVYSMESKEDHADLKAELARGTIFRFPYSYRGGLEADAGFLLMSDSDEIMFVVGTRTNIEFIGIQTQAASAAPEDEVEVDMDDMSFDMI